VGSLIDVLILVGLVAVSVAGHYRLNKIEALLTEDDEMIGIGFSYDPEDDGPDYESYV
jgi:hypothetical protein